MPERVGSVRVCECWARDGLQSWPEVIPLATKTELLHKVIAAGITEIDATSFVPAKLLPQFADSVELLEGLAETGVRARVLAPNLKGVKRAAELAPRLPVITTVGFPISASEQHNIANVRRTHSEHLSQIAEMVPRAHDAGLRVLAAVATAYGCPIVGNVPEQAVFEIVDLLAELTVDRMMLSDTTGLADPLQVIRYTTRMREQYPDIDLIAHFHDTRGTGIANTWAAVSAGAGCVDACLGGIGGEPSTVEQNHAGETGNISTEDMVVLLERAGIGTGIDVETLVAAGRFAELALGVAGRSQVLRTGPGLDRTGQRAQG